MKRTLLVGAALIAAMTFVGTSEAEAGGFGIQLHVGHGHGGYGFVGRGNTYFNRGYIGRQPYFSGYRGFNSFRQPRYHDTSHYDYHPGTYVPHGNHLHYIPGHYHFHQEGHWHR